MTADARDGDLRVMIVTDQYAPMVGGVPTVTRELARGLAERGHRVVLVAPSSTGRTRTDAADGQLTVSLRGSLRWPWYEGQRLGLLSPAAARQFLDDFAPDVVHLHSPLTLGATFRAAARRRGIPVVYTNHYLPANVWPGAVTGTPPAGRTPFLAISATARSVALDTGFYAYVTGFANRCDHVTAPTATAILLLREHGLRVPSQVVSNGIDLASYAPDAPPGTPAPAAASLRARYALPEGRLVILSVGRLSPEKNADVLIAAMARLPARPRQQAPLLVLAGSGPDAGRLRALAARLGVADKVRFPGFVPGGDLPGLYRLADVFAIASRAELQSLATMEAMASGLPVVAVNAGALGELVHAGENGFLVTPRPPAGPGDGNAADFADCLGLLIADSELRARMARASLRIIREHDRHRLLARWESLYGALAARGAARGSVSTAAEKNRRR